MFLFLSYRKVQNIHFELLCFHFSLDNVLQTIKNHGHPGKNRRYQKDERKSKISTEWL